MLTPSGMRKRRRRAKFFSETTIRRRPKRRPMPRRPRWSRYLRASARLGKPKRCRRMPCLWPFHSQVAQNNGVKCDKCAPPKRLKLRVAIDRVERCRTEGRVSVDATKQFEAWRENDSAGHLCWLTTLLQMSETCRQKLWKV